MEEIAVRFPSPKGYRRLRLMLTARSWPAYYVFGMTRVAHVSAADGRWSVRRSLFAMIGGSVVIWGLVLALVI